jgi:hypothetical protein
VKIALCISGFMRYYHKNIISLQKYFPYQFDTFIHTWNTKDHHISEQLNKSEIQNLYNPISIIYENPINFDISQELKDKNIYNKRNLNGILSMYYKIYQCNQLKIFHENQNNFKYDVVIRYRSDIELLQTFNLNNYSKINIPKYGDFTGICDQIAYSNSENMDKYSNLYLNINNYIQDMLCSDPEAFMKNHLLNLGISVTRFDLNYNLLSHGVTRKNFDVEKSWILELRKI